MARYAFSAGMRVPPEVMQSLPLMEAELKKEPVAESGSLMDIAQLHVQLAALVAPAMPRTLYLLQRDRARNSWLSILGPLPAVRRLMLASLFFTLVFILSSLSPHINIITMRLDIYRMDELLLLHVLVFLMSAAGIGATFQALFTAHSSIANGTYDPRYESSFWTQISLGVIAGLVLSQVIPLGPENLKNIVSLDADGMTALMDIIRSQGMTHTLASFGIVIFEPSGHPASQEALKSILDSLGTSSDMISKPVLALLGGFSATLVYTVMQRLVTTVESLFKSNDSESRALREKAVLDMVAQRFGTHDRLQTASGKPELAPKAPSTNGTVVSLIPQGQPSSQQGEKTEGR